MLCLQQVCIFYVFSNHKIENVATSDSLCVVVTKDGMVYKSGREEHELGTGQDSNHPGIV